MRTRDNIKSELYALYKEGVDLAIAFQEKKEQQFEYAYQRWYTKSLKAVSSLAADRLVEFRGYYEIDPKRKSLGYGTYVIQDFLKGVAPSRAQYPDFNTRDSASRCFYNQLTILASLEERIDSTLSNIEGGLLAEFQDNEIAIAKQLAKISLRASGALAGVIIESHLQKVSQARDVKITKKFPTIADLNDPLKSAEVIDIPTWRKITYLADIRNICSHKKDSEPTKEQVDELIQGAEWLVKNIF